MKTREEWVHAASWRTTKPAGTKATSARVSCAICLQRSAERYRWDLVGRRAAQWRPSEALHVTDSDVPYISPQTTEATTVGSRCGRVLGQRGAGDGRFEGKVTAEAP